MGTRADFYVGTGEDAEWLGSIAWDGYPTGIPSELLQITNETIWRDQVKLFLMERKDGTLPEHGWPWPWNDSHTTDYTYAFWEGGVWSTCFGKRWFNPNIPESEEGDEEETIVFPDMTERKNVTYGKRSGLLVVTSHGILDED